MIYLLLLLSVIGEVQERYLMVFSNKDYCPPCLKMDTETFTNEAVKEELKTFKVYENLPKKSYKEWHVDKIPTYIVVKKVPGGFTEDHRHIGFLEATKFVEFLKKDTNSIIKK